MAAVGGVLVADREYGLPDKLVDHAGAAAFAGLKDSGPPPPVVAARLAEFVMDGILSLQVGDRFLSGPAAWQAVWAQRRRVPRNRLGRLSVDALAYAERLRLTETAVLASRLYAYHRVPISKHWARALPGRAALVELLGGAGLRQVWQPRSGAGSKGWLSWVRAGAEVEGPPPYKLYVSPAVDALRAVLPTLVDVLTAAGATRFKVGADVAGLLRPDKIVVYPASREELEGVAAALADALVGVAPHGVPFTAELHGSGLLSWSGDPPGDAGPVGARPESWRLSVARRLAEYLVAAHHAGLSGEAATGFALARLEVDGVDVPSFVPSRLAHPRQLGPSRR